MKKMLSYFICFAMLLSSVTVIASQTSEGKYEVSENSLFNLIEAVPFEGDKSMTKAEASYYLAQIVKGTGNTNNIYFEDVDQKHPYFSHINFVFESNLFERQNNKFYPEQEIKVKDFLEASLKLAGFEEYVSVRGITYQKLMSELDVSKKIITILEHAITPENFEEVLYAAINIPTCQFSGVKMGGASMVVDYVIDEDEVLIETYRKIKKIKGRIVADENVYLYGYNSSGGERVLFADEYGDEYNLQYDYSMIISDVIGLEIDAYLNDDEDTLLYYYKVKDRSERVVINASDMGDVKTDMSQLTYYNENGRLKTLKFSDETTFVYNGKNCYGIIPEYFTSENSRTVAIDIDDNGLFDIVFVDRYVDIIVSDVNEEVLSITDLCDLRTYRFDEFDNVTVIKNNKIVDFSSIVKECVVSMAISLDGESVTIYISSNEVFSGYLNGKGSDYILADGVRHSYSCSADVAGIKLGSECMFGVNFYGYIGCIKKLADTDLLYGYLVWMSYSDEGFDENTYLKVLTPDNKYAKLKFAEKYRINDEKIEHVDITPLFKENGKVKHQLVKYMLDANGDIKKLYYAQNVNSAVMKDDFTGLHFNRHYTQGESYVRNASISMEYLTGPDTVKYVVCTDVLGNVIEERTWCYNGGFKTSKPDMKIYDAGLNRVIGAMVVTMTEDDVTKYIAMTSSNYRGIVVETCGMCLDQYGDIRSYIEGWQENALRRYYAPYDQEFKSIERGDVLILDYFDDNDVLYKYTKIFTLTDDSDEGNALIADKTYSESNLAYYNTSVSDKTSALVNVYGRVVAIDGKLSNPYKPIVVRCAGTQDNSSDIACMLNVNTSSVYVYYLDSGNAEVVTYSEIKTEDDVFVHCREGIVTEVVILR